jgi:hypothetical protein
MLLKERNFSGPLAQGCFCRAWFPKINRSARGKYICVNIMMAFGGGVGGGITTVVILIYAFDGFYWSVSRPGRLTIWETAQSVK